MITPEWVRTMARHGAAQNRAYAELTADMPEEDWWADRGAFFGSLGATSNHILWADRMWLSRLAEGPVPAGGAGGVNLAPTRAAWAEMRAETDAHLRDWAEKLGAEDLAGDLDWTSGLAGPMRRPRALVVTHLFTHAIHHRGQVHAMLTAMGRDTPTTDLVFLPEVA